MSDKKNSDGAIKLEATNNVDELHNVWNNPFSGTTKEGCVEILTNIFGDSSIPEWEKQVRLSQAKETNFPGYKLFRRPPQEQVVS